MQIVKGMIVKSISGHDKDRYYLVISLEGSSVWIADGKRRKLERPKKKNSKHIQATKTVVEPSLYCTDRGLRNLLWEWNYSDKAATG